MSVTPIARGGRPAGAAPGTDPTDAMDEDSLLDAAFPGDKPRRLGTVGLTPEVAQPRSRFKTYSTAALLDLPPLEWMVDGMLPAGGLAAVVGAPEAGKSLIVLDLAYSVALGRPFLGNRVRKGGVLYLAAEGAAGQQDRVRAWLTAHEVRPDAPDLAWVTQGANLLEKTDALHIIRAAQQALAHEPALIILDTLHRVSGGADENSASDLGLVIHHADWIREQTGACVLFLHHTRKDGDLERGTSALRGALDTMILVKDDDGRRLVSCEKQKDAKRFAPIVVELEAVAGSVVARRSSAHWSDNPPPPKADQLKGRHLTALRALDRANTLTSTEWSECAGMPKSSFYAARGDLVSGGYVELKGQRYVFTDEGRRAFRWSVAREQREEQYRQSEAAESAARESAARVSRPAGAGETRVGLSPAESHASPTAVSRPSRASLPTAISTQGQQPPRGAAGNGLERDSRARETRDETETPAGIRGTESRRSRETRRETRTGGETAPPPWDGPHPAERGDEP